MRRRFPNDPGCVPAVRDFARRQLREFDPELSERVALIVTELATNSIRHAGAGFSVAVAVDSTVIRIEVGDASPRRPTKRDPGPDDVGGRGLRIVEALADRWGVVERPNGKAVWVELDRPIARR